MLWAGIKNVTVEGLKGEQPISDLPWVHWLILDDDPLGIKQMILEFETEVIVCDAPPQFSDKVIQWIAQNLNKPITHLWVSSRSKGLPECLAYNLVADTPPPRP